jgi:hypothetical protein
MITPAILCIDSSCNAMSYVYTMTFFRTFKRMRSGDFDMWRFIFSLASPLATSGSTSSAGDGSLYEPFDH